MSDLSDWQTGQGRHARPRPESATEEPPGEGGRRRAVHRIELSALKSDGLKIWRVTRGHRPLLVTGIVLGFLGAVATLTQPLLIGLLIDAVEDGRSLTGLITMTVVFFLVDAALSALHGYVIGRVGENIVYDIRETLSTRLLRSRFPEYSQWKRGDVYSRMVGDTSLARVSMTGAVDEIINSTLLVVGGIALMFWIDPMLLGITVACLGTASIISLILARQVRKVSVTNRENTTAYGSALRRVLDALPTVKASRAEAREAKEIAALAQKSRRSGLRATAIGAMLTPSIDVGTQLALAAVITVGVARTSTGSLEAGSLTAFIIYLFYLVTPLIGLFSAIATYQGGKASLDRIAELGSIAVEEEQETESGTKPANATPHLAPLDGYSLTFDQVSFCYPDKDNVVLDQVSFSVPDRGLTAIVGPSGTGKSTIFQLIERLYTPTSGAIRIGSTDIGQIPLSRLRSLIGYVDQDHTLLRGTVRENVVYAAPNAGEADITEALRLSHLTETIANLPDGLDTELGERGAGLSGGQRQRLAIARTLLQAPRFILLDEATANLDGESEAALRESIAMISEFCAVIAIAHRLSTVTNARKIIVLDKGKVQATGTHFELRKTNPLYRRLSDFQVTNAQVAEDPLEVDNPVEVNLQKEEARL